MKTCLHLHQKSGLSFLSFRDQTIKCGTTLKPNKHYIFPNYIFLNKIKFENKFTSPPKIRSLFPLLPRRFSGKGRLPPHNPGRA